MAEANLNAQRLRECIDYNPDTGIFTRGGRDKPCGRIATKGYRQISVGGHRYMAHRLAWLYVVGEWPDSQIDHKNQHKDDNRIDNLRIASNKQNAENITMFKSNTSGRKGVRFNPRFGRWVAEIKHHKHSYHLGIFDNIIDAVAARMRAEIAMFTHSPLLTELRIVAGSRASASASMPAPGITTE